MGTEPYEPIHIALAFKLISTTPSIRQDYLNTYSPDTLARILAVLYSCVFLEDPTFTHDDETRIMDLADHVMSVLISKLAVNEPF